jgi:hypothetical protein
VVSSNDKHIEEIKWNERTYCSCDPLTFRVRIFTRSLAGKLLPIYLSLDLACCQHFNFS